MAKLTPQPQLRKAFVILEFDDDTSEAQEFFGAEETIRTWARDYDTEKPNVTYHFKGVGTNKYDAAIRDYDLSYPEAKVQLVTSLSELLDKPKFVDPEEETND